MPEKTRRWQFVGGLVLLALLAALFAPTVGWLVRSWRVHPYYSHGLLMPAVAAWFAWRARAQFSLDTPHDTGLLLIAGGVGLHLTALRWAANPLSSAALLLVLSGFALLAGGPRAFRAAAFPLALLALAVPIPLTRAAGATAGRGDSPRCRFGRGLYRNGGRPGRCAAHRRRRVVYRGGPVQRPEVLGRPGHAGGSYRRRCRRTPRWTRRPGRPGATAGAPGQLVAPTRSAVAGRHLRGRSSPDTVPPVVESAHLRPGHYRPPRRRQHPGMPCPRSILSPAACTTSVDGSSLPP